MITGEAIVKRTFRDRCQVLTRLSEDESLEPTVSWEAGAEIPCRVDLTPYIRNEADGSQVPQESFWIRVPLGTVVTRTSRIRLTQLWGKPITYQEFAVISEPIQTPDCISAYAQRIVGETIY